MISRSCGLFRFHFRDESPRGLSKDIILAANSRHGHVCRHRRCHLSLCRQGCQVTRTGLSRAYHEQGCLWNCHSDCTWYHGVSFPRSLSHVCSSRLTVLCSCRSWSQASSTVMWLVNTSTFACSGTQTTCTVALSSPLESGLPLHWLCGSLPGSLLRLSLFSTTY